MTDSDRLMARTVRKGNCWEWARVSSPDGYGRFRFRGAQWLAHRASYALHVGPIPEGLDLDHLCRNRRCVNPSHLEPVTRSENLHRSPLMDRNSKKTHCPAGHEYTQENTRRSGPRRHCRACQAGRWDAEKYAPITPCDLCGKEMRRNNISRHMRDIHERLGLS